MTTLISLFGIVGRFAGDLLMSALGWASSLLFGRVPRSHQVFLVGMMAGSLLWILAVLSLVLPSIVTVLLSTTPHPPFVNAVWLGAVLLGLALLLPAAVGLASVFVPTAGRRPVGLAMVREVLRGYLLAPVISFLLVFLAGVGMVRKVRSARHGWSDTHIAIVVKPGGYDQMAVDLADALNAAGVPVEAGEAPWVLTLPARILSTVAGASVRTLRLDHLVELRGRELRVGLYPSDIAISAGQPTRTKARAALLARLTTTEAHLTTSAEAQGMEDRLEHLAASRARPGSPRTRAALATIDSELVQLSVSTDEWDILYRLRLQVERDLLRGDAPA